MSAPLIAIADYGMGNRRSVEKALEHVGARPQVTRDLDLLRSADGVILPGVGAFPEAMRHVTRLGLDGPLCERARDGAPLLGLCLGMQLLFERSSEHEGAAGLGLLPGAVTPLRSEAGQRPPSMPLTPMAKPRSTPPCAAAARTLPERCSRPARIRTARHATAPHR